MKFNEPDFTLLYCNAAASLPVLICCEILLHSRDNFFHLDTGYKAELSDIAPACTVMECLRSSLGSTEIIVPTIWLLNTASRAIWRKNSCVQTLLSRHKYLDDYYQYNFSSGLFLAFHLQSKHPELEPQSHLVS